jgi:hypothetical protein
MTESSISSALTAWYRNRFGGGWGWLEEPEVRVFRRDYARYEIEFTQMYDALDRFAFEDLEVLSRVFGTKNINFGDDVSVPGCETCDYYSRYGFSVMVRDATKVDLGVLD